MPAIMLGFDAAIAGGDAINAYKRGVKYTATAAQTICRQALDGFAAFGDLGAYLQNKEAQPSVGPARGARRDGHDHPDDAVGQRLPGRQLPALDPGRAAA